jgi:murein DD-endopeptidase MepM/ murein hydrolase activator NlpD
MAKKSKKSRRYTILFIPEGDDRSFSFKVHTGVVKTLLYVGVLFVIGLLVLLLKSGQIGARLQLVYFLREENERLRLENTALQLNNQQLQRLQKMSEYIERLATAAGIDHEIFAPVPAISADAGEIFTRDSLDNMLEKIRHGTQSAESNAQLLGNTPNIRPVAGWITREFHPVGDREGLAHLGLDFAATEGSLIKATAPGTVDNVAHDTYFGLMVTIRHAAGFVTRYAHCSQILVKRGDRVDRGQSIALVGNTGRSSGPHLHYEILKDGKHLNPAAYILDSQKSGLTLE